MESLVASLGAWFQVGVAACGVKAFGGRQQVSMWGE